MKRVTQQEVGLAAGVSKATVSRALCGDPRIPPETTERVRATAERLGYRPDPALAEIAAARWRQRDGRAGVTFAYISQLRQEPVGADWVNRQGVEARATELGCRIDHFVLEDHAGSAALQRILTARGIRGLILGTFFEPQPLLALDWNRYCAVNIAHSDYQPPLHMVAHDAFNGVLLAWHRALSYGYRRPGLVILRHARPASVEDDENRRAAAFVLHADAPSGRKVPPMFYSSREPYDVVAPRVVAWYRKWKPDAVIGFNTFIRDILVHEGHVRIPATTGFASLTGEQDNPYAGISDSALEIGRAAVDFLQLALRTNQWGLPRLRIRHYLEPEWIDGATLPRREGAKNESDDPHNV